jgi:ribonucleoside-diphosphate reductase alpha chain
MPEYSERIKNVAEKRLLLKALDGTILEDIDGMFKRVATYLGSNAEEAEEFYTVMANNQFLPNSPCLVNAGVEGRANQLAACFVIDIQDSLEDIYDKLKASALIFKSGGGVGFNFSNLRAANSIVSTTKGVASGPVSFMQIFDASVEGIKQGGVRRGAAMGILRVDHPDIEEFIQAKLDGVTLQNFNISVAVTNKFMMALIERKDYELICPQTKKTVAKVSARKIFDMIVDCAWKTGDPGVVYIDRMNDHNPLRGDSNLIVATNPCVIGSTKILTRQGYKEIATLEGQPTEIWNGYEWSVVTPRVTAENQPTVTVTTSDGQSIVCTPYHKFFVHEGFARNGKQFIKTAEQLATGDKLPKSSFPVIEGSQAMSAQVAYTYGFYCGDGSKETTRERNSISLYGEKQHLLERLVYEHVNHCADGKMFVKIPNFFNNKTFVPDAAYSIQTRLDYLAGLIDSDGTLNDAGGSIAIWSSNKDFLIATQQMLHTLGCSSTVNLGTPGKLKQMPDGKGKKAAYQTQDCYRLVISAAYVEELKALGLQTYQVPLQASPNRKAARFTIITSVTPAVVADKVYCFNEPKRHTAIFNGMLTSQCGEEPLADNECCGLGSINLSSCVVDGKLDLGLLRRVAMTGTKFLGRMLMASEYPSEVIDTKVKASRKIGLGHMGFADVLIKLKIAYTSEEAIEIAEQIGQTILDASVAASHQEGQKLGTFPLLDDYVAPEHIKKALEREGIPLSVYTPAYSALTTIAPTGTLSILAECSSGVEPVFYLEQEEHRADAVITHLHPLYAAWKAAHTTSKKPYYFQDLKDIDVSTHIAIQSTFQRYVCSAISKTINMPFTATKEMVAQAILESYHTGCKGITIYRDGSKATQVIYDSNGANHRHSKSAIVPDPRPETLDGTTYEIKTGYGIMLVTINSYDEQPFEVICQLGKSGASEMAKAEAISRLASILLRCGVDIKTIISQLEGIVGGNPIHTKHGLVTSIPDALAKIMQLHTNKAIIIQVPPMMKCEECGAGAEMIEAEGSCLKCTVCGWKSCS